MARILESTFLSGPAGRLEALHEGPEEEIRIARAAVVCHPHPLFGGTMHNKVVFRLARAARKAGSAVLRFNFRGVGQSAGAHDEGRGEQDDVRAAIAYLKDRYPGLPLLAAGFSFGASVGIRVACRDSHVERFIAAGLPVNRAKFEFLSSCACPKVFIHSTNDEHGSRENLETVYSAAAEPKKLCWIEAGDHFFAGALDEFEEAAFEAFNADSQ
jgi:uncharacterized protein